MATNFADSGQYTDAQMNMRKRLAEAMIKNGLETTPIQSHWQGLARLANALVGGYMSHKLGEEDKQREKSSSDALLGLFDGPGGGSVASPASSTPLASPKPATSTFSEPPEAVAPSARKPKSFAPEIEASIERHAKATGLDPAYLRAAVDIESGGDPNNATGSYIGLGQLSKEEFAKYGGKGDIRDPDENLRVFAVKTAAERDDFKRKHGRDASPADIYLTHQQGAAGYAAHMKNPDGVAWQNIRPYYSDEAARRKGFKSGDEYAKAAIWGNLPDSAKKQFGSVDNVTSSGFTDWWRGRVNRGLGAAAPTAVASAQPDAGEGAPTAAVVDPANEPPADAEAATAPQKPVQMAQAPTATVTDASATPPAPVAQVERPQPTLDPRIRAMLQHPDRKIQAMGRALATQALQKSLAGDQQTPLQRAQLEKTIVETQAEKAKLPKPEEEVGKQFAGGIEQLAAIPQKFGTEAFERAVGPWSATDPNPESAGGVWGSGVSVGQLGQQIARGIGEAKAAISGGAAPTEVRDTIETAMKNLAAVMKPLIRKPGEGAWSDKDQANLEAQIGQLARSRSVEEYGRRLDGLRENVEKIFRIKVPVKVTGVKPPTKAEDEEGQGEELAARLKKGVEQVMSGLAARGDGLPGPPSPAPVMQAPETPERRRRRLLEALAAEQATP